ncbi:hypothetical protein ACX27O_26655 [Micromonospora sp. SD19]|uniref:Uncharacterized protein n=1 Tax=Micromonospora parva TaxID=1464048 RepID=A0ABW6VLV3_9ACTN|nr:MULTISPECIES: hypothetical protein [Micromonospora]
MRPGRIRRRVGAAAVGVVVAVSTYAVPGYAAPVPIDEAALHDSLYAAAVQSRTTGVAGVVDAVVAAEIVDWRAAHPNVDGTQVVRHFGRTDAAVRAAVSGVGSSEGLAAFAAAAAGLLAVPVDQDPAQAALDRAEVRGSSLRALLTATTGEELGAVVTPTEQVRTGSQNFLWEVSAPGRLAGAWKRLHRAASTDAGLRTAWDGTYAARLSVRLDTPAQDLMALPAFASRVDLPGILAKKDDEAAFSAAVRTAVQAQFEALEALANDRITAATALNAKFPIEGAKPTAAEEAAAKKSAEDAKKLVSEAGSLLTVVLGDIGGIYDPKFAKTVKTVGDALVKSVTSVISYEMTIASGQLTGAASAAAALSLTGNFIGAAMALLPLFMGQESPDQMISKQIKGLSEQVRRMAEGIGDRFDRVDAKLTAMYDGLSTQLGLLGQDVREVKRILGVIGDQLHTMDQKIDQMALANQAAFEQLAADDVDDATDRYLHRAVRVDGGAIGSVAEYFDEVDSPTRTFATTAAKKAPFVVPAGTSTANPVSVLDLHLPNGAIDYLAGWAAAKGVPLRPATGDQAVSGVANPSAWLIGARANLVMQLENPQFAAAVTAEHTAGTLDAGNRVNQRVRQFSNPGAGGVTNELFTRLVADYRAALDGWSDALDDVGRAVRWNQTDPAYPAAGNDRTYDLWGAPDQALPAAAQIPDAPGLTPCRVGDIGMPAWSVPATLRNSDLPAYYDLLAYAAPPGYRPTLRTCIEGDFVNVKETIRPKYEIYSGDLKITLRHQVKQGGSETWQDVRSVTTTRPVGVYCEIYNGSGPYPDTECHSPSDYVLTQWPQYLNALQTQGTVTTHPQVDNDTLARTRSMLSGRQKYFYRVAAAGTGVEAPPVTTWAVSQTLWEKGRQLAESVRLLQAFTQLGWASALDRDEMMHLVLFGDRSLPGDYTAPRGDLNGDTGRRYLQTAYAQAVSNYAGCAQAVDWDPCQGLNSGFDAKQGQNPYFACGQVDRPNAPVDPLGRCVYAVAGDRTNELAGRYAHWSAEIAGGRHREGIPEVTTVTNLLRITNEHLH